MLSVPAFMQGIVTDNPTEDYTHNFNKMMVLYRLLGGRPGISISTTHENGTGFDIKTRTKRDATSVNRYINQVTYTVYGNKYFIVSECEQKLVHVNISKANS